MKFSSSAVQATGTSTHVTTSTIKIIGFRFNVKNGDQIKAIKIQLFNNDVLQGTYTYNYNEWSNNVYCEKIMSSSYNINKVKIWFELNPGYSFGTHNANVYDFQVCKV